MKTKFTKIICTALAVSSLLISGASAASLMTEEHIEKLQAYSVLNSVVCACNSLLAVLTVLFYHRTAIQRNQSLGHCHCPPDCMRTK